MLNTYQSRLRNPQKATLGLRRRDLSAKKRLQSTDFKPTFTISLPRSQKLYCPPSVSVWHPGRLGFPSLVVANLFPSYSIMYIDKRNHV